MKPYYEDGSCVIYHGDCREVLPGLSTVGCVLVTDPPYGIGHSSNKAGAPRRGRQIENDESTKVRDEVLAGWVGPAVVFGSCAAPVPPMPIRAVLVWDKGGHVGQGDLSLPWKQNWEHIYISGAGFQGRRDTGVLRALAIAPWAGELVHPHEKPISLLRMLYRKVPSAGGCARPLHGQWHNATSRQGPRP